MLDVLDVAPLHLIGVLFVASAACAGTVALWWTAQPRPLAAGRSDSALVSADGAPSDDLPGPALPTSASGLRPATGNGDAPVGLPADTVVVHVSGAVSAPGVHELPADARVHHALDAAGGVTASASTDGLNLARPVRDGEQIHVPDVSDLPTSPAAGPAALAAPGAAGQGDPGGLINLNHASIEQLETLPGVGPVLAERIVTQRQVEGSFTSIDELRTVDGIGDKTFAALEPLVTV